MTITKRKLMAWRREALKQQLNHEIKISEAREANARILALTQELIDQKLLTEAMKENRS